MASLPACLHRAAAAGSMSAPAQVVCGEEGRDEQDASAASRHLVTSIAFQALKEIPAVFPTIPCCNWCSHTAMLSHMRYPPKAFYFKTRQGVAGKQNKGKRHRLVCRNAWFRVST